MSNYSEILGLDSKRLSTLGKVYFGYAESLIKSENKKYYHQIASCYTISAILKSILKPGSGTEAFYKAAKYYKFEQNSYSLICSICAYDINSIKEYSYNENPKSKLNLLEVFLVSNLLEGYFENDVLRHSISIGRLNIPLEIYIAALEDVYNLNSKNFIIDKSFSNIKYFLKRSSENVYLLKQNSFHWKNLLGNFIPLEPEILAFCIVLCKKLKEASIALEEVLSGEKIDSIAKIPLQIANEIIENEEIN